MQVGSTHKNMYNIHIYKLIYIYIHRAYIE